MMNRVRLTFTYEVCGLLSDDQLHTSGNLNPVLKSLEICNMFKGHSYLGNVIVTCGEASRSMDHD